VNQVDERRRTAVHDRHFGRVQFDDDVVDAQADERRQEMFDGVYADRITHQAGCVVDAVHVLDGRGHFQPAQIGPAEADAGIRRSRLQRKADLVTGVETDSGAGNGSSKGSLCVHLAVRPLTQGSML
jgi:hypothetical protein